MSKYPVAFLASALAVLAIADAAQRPIERRVIPTPRPAPIILVGDVEVDGSMVAQGGVVGASGYFTGDVRTAGSLLTNSTTTGIGYAQTAGGSIRQTEFGKPVVMNRPCGQLLTAPVYLAPGRSTTFSLFNTCIERTDVVAVCVQGYAGGGLVGATITATWNGGANITLTNFSDMAVNNVVYLNIALVKAVDF
jgi:hypothetical protein